MPYSGVWDETTPNDETDLEQGQAAIRALRLDIRERLETIFASIDTDPLTFLASVVTTAALQDLAVTAAKLADNAVVDRVVHDLSGAKVAARTLLASALVGVADTRKVYMALVGALTVAGTGSLAGTSVYTVSGPLLGAAIGDPAIIVPQLSGTGTEQWNSQLVIHCWVSAADTVSLSIANPSATAGLLYLPGNYKIVVLKEVG